MGVVLSAHVFHNVLWNIRPSRAVDRAAVVEVKNTPQAISIMVKLTGQIFKVAWLLRS